jgi:hypothetical protein
LQEWFGYCLTHDTSKQKMLFLKGSKRSAYSDAIRAAIPITFERLFRRDSSTDSDAFEQPFRWHSSGRL